MGHSAQPSRRSRRRLSVDALRGATIIAMILVNNPGDWSTVYGPLLHADWHGWTPTDLVFPFFLFVVGISIVLALGPAPRPSPEVRALLPKILRRGVVLFALGLFLSGFPFGLFGPRTFERLLETWRIPGVLQRIALCYTVVSLLFLTLDRRRLAWINGALLFGYWGLMTWVPVPGQGAPDLDSKGGHLAGWLDRLIFGDHLWISAKVYDPEGLLSTLPALSTTLFGVFAGLLLTSRLPEMEKVARLLGAGVLLTAAGTAWGWIFPINKALWTSSYAVMTAGQAACALGLCVAFFDLERGRRWGEPLRIYGQNAITVFVGSGLLARTLAYLEIGDRSLQRWIYEGLFAVALPPHLASLAYALAWILGWFAVLWLMDRRGLVLKV